jgi:hypothetical protein
MAKSNDQKDLEMLTRLRTLVAEAERLAGSLSPTTARSADAAILRHTLDVANQKTETLFQSAYFGVNGTLPS